MAVKTLVDLKKDFLKTYYSISSGKVLLDLIFTDYKNSPSELKAIPSLEVLAKQKVSQIPDATVIPPVVVEDLFTILQQIILLDPNQLTELQQEITAQALELETVEPFEGDTGAPPPPSITDAGGGGG
jgi:hypothetical protein